MSGARRTALWQQLLPWAISLACFAYLYGRIARAAGERSVPLYLAEVFASVNWTAWLALMVPYSLLYLAVDTLVLWRAVNWFNARISYGSLLPLRASSYIISILNEQVGKGAIALYLNRREAVPGLQLASSLLFIMFCEFYYLLCWALLGWNLSGDALPAALGAIPWIAVVAGLLFAIFVWFFRGARFDRFALRERQLFHAFRRAPAWRYGVIMLLRSPALLAAVWVYARAAALFGVEISLLDMLGALPIIFFGTLIPGPFRAAAISLWTLLMPDQDAGRVAAFGFVQHNFFLLFNAAIGLLFLRRANRALFGPGGKGSNSAQ